MWIPVGSSPSSQGQQQQHKQQPQQQLAGSSWLLQKLGAWKHKAAEHVAAA